MEGWRVVFSGEWECAGWGGKAHLAITEEALVVHQLEWLLVRVAGGAHVGLLDVAVLNL